MEAQYEQDKALLINYNWHHAVNDQTKLTKVLDLVTKSQKNGEVSKPCACGAIEAIEADIIYSSIKSQAVMGHPPSTDGDLTLSSFLEQLRQVNFQQQHGSSRHQTECPVLKLDFKSMAALQSSLEVVKRYLADLPPSLHQRVWINADILPGPGENLNDGMAQKRVQPKFDTAEFLQVVTSTLPETVLSIGWVTSLTDIHAEYTDNMINDMIKYAKDSNSLVTFPVRASCFRKSWNNVLQKLYQVNDQWTVTLWWSKELPKEEFDWIYDTLEGSDELRNRTYYDLEGFHQYLTEHRG